MNTAMVFSVSPTKHTPREHWTKNAIGIPTMKRGIVAFTGPCMVERSRDDFYGGEKSRPYTGRIIVNPTWGDLLNEARRSMRVVRDLHHSFFEGAHIKEVRVVNGQAVNILKLSLGS